MTDTPERCGLGIRGVAMWIDSVVWFAFFFVAVPLVAAVTGQFELIMSGVQANLEGTPAVVALSLWLALGIGYHSLFEWRYGKTLGKYLVGIRAVSEDGSALSLQSSLVRNVARLVDFLPLYSLVGIVAILLSDEDKRLGDRWAGSLVIR